MLRDSARYSVNNVIMEGGERFALLIDKATGLPDPFTTRYSAVFLRSKGGSVNSMAKAMRAVALALEWAGTRGIDLTQRIDSGDLLTQEETTDLVNWLRLSRRKPTKAEKLTAQGVKPKRRAVDTRNSVPDIVDAETHYARVLDVRAYIAWRVELALHRIPIASGRYRDAAQKLADWKTMIAGQVRSGKLAKKYGLPPELRARFLEIVHPDCSENPFDPAHRYRNYALLLMYYELGLRRAEALVLKTGDLRFSGNQPSLHVHRRADDPDDPRPDEPLVKTAGRLLPVGQNLRQAVETWLIRHRADRTRYPGAKKTPYVFVAENGRPMALRTVNDLFIRIRDRFPEFPRNLSPHMLRHDWNDRFSDLCDAERQAQTTSPVAPDDRLTHAKEMALRNYLMGWKKHSERAATYTNRTTEVQAASLMLRLQERSANG
ncbi:tyrosine-type recombinase/integrase [Azospirillum formosense]|uniref:Tyrosine-type recombinase/integrase n=2 Tax=Azospirillum formosense TaxID=861533 RepID=A0ABX2KT98_9PROT|nr:tyrosine-type recombinase/integrase [Azospirillum formosense]MBY3755530.1 tyrosine-type recombinase/integrase [Azospirillum formosense]NUB19806.1 tyrosine-type recombinase/integrase [Azospirillum formosense]